MSIELFRAFLGWTALLNLIVVSLWFFAFVLAHDWMLGLHRRWFPISRQAFDVIHYAGMAWYKICNLAFFLIPYFVLHFLL